MGMYSNEYLREKKRSPYNTSKLAASLNPIPDKLTVIAGVTQSMQEGLAVSIWGMPRFQIKTVGEYTLLDAILASPRGDVLAIIKENEILLATKALKDASFDPKSYHWRIDAGRDGKLELFFRRLDLNGLSACLLREWGKIPWIRANSGFILACCPGPAPKKFLFDFDADAPQLAHRKADAMIKEADPSDGCLPMLTFSTDVPIVDSNGNSGTLQIRPWKVDFRFDKRVKRFRFDRACEVTRPPRGDTTPFLRTNPWLGTLVEHTSAQENEIITISSATGRNRLRENIEKIRGKDPSAISKLHIDLLSKDFWGTVWRDIALRRAHFGNYDEAIAAHIEARDAEPTNRIHHLAVLQNIYKHNPTTSIEVHLATARQHHPDDTEILHWAAKVQSQG